MAEIAGERVRQETPVGVVEASRMGRAEAGQSRWWVRYPWGAEAFYGTADQVVAHIRGRTSDAKQTLADPSRG